MRSLRARALWALAITAVVMAVALFVPAGTVRYWEAWVYLLIFFGAGVPTTLSLARRDPALLERRMRGGPTAEKRTAQRIIMTFTSLGFIALLVVPALDHRFGWSSLPILLVIAGDVLVAVGFLLILRVYRENTFSAATVQVAPDQRVISTGPYAIVRHPMYASASLYLIGTPLALGSAWGLLAFVATLPFLIWRLLDEEHLLARELPGYTDYQRHVRYRLLPHVW
jgi:protein-S-isoprenylcysteine O-methyltransferase Ste14